jgi:hypothetical protein
MAVMTDITALMSCMAPGPSFFIARMKKRRNYLLDLKKFLRR